MLVYSREFLMCKVGTELTIVPHDVPVAKATAQAIIKIKDGSAAGGTFPCNAVAI
jgi:hypothetical protein